MKFIVSSLFPDFVDSYGSTGVFNQANKKNLVSLQTINPRDYTDDLHQTVDDRPYGGGDGMVMKYEPMAKLVANLRANGFGGKILLTSPRGQLWTSQLAQGFAAEKELLFVCGRYSGIDQRFINKYVDAEYSIGDYVLSGGEIAAMTMIDSIARYIPGVLGNEISSHMDSHNNDLLEGPLFSRPAVMDDQMVPEILTSGNHKAIDRFNEIQSAITTYLNRPDMFDNCKYGKKQLLQFWSELQGMLSEKEMASCGLNQKHLSQLKALEEELS